MPELSDFFLVGGTALALQIGHRKSIDLDFFTLAPFDEEQLVKALQSHFSMTLNSQNTNTLLCEIENVKVDFIAHQYRQLKNNSIHGSIKLASLEDIAAMKLNAIKNRGSKKDFVDLYFLIKELGFEQMLSFFTQKYPNQSELMILKSLTYFTDAETEPEPIVLLDCTWSQVKHEIEARVNQFIENQ